MLEPTKWRLTVSRWLLYERANRTRNKARLEIKGGRDAVPADFIQKSSSEPSIRCAGRMSAGKSCGGHRRIAEVCLKGNMRTS